MENNNNITQEQIIQDIESLHIQLVQFSLAVVQLFCRYPVAQKAGLFKGLRQTTGLMFNQVDAMRDYARNTQIDSFIEIEDEQA